MADSVGVFFALATQWRWVSMGLAGALKTGLDYQAIDAVASGLDVAVTPQLFNDLRLMEAGALDVWSRRR